MPLDLQVSISLWVLGTLVILAFAGLYAVAFWLVGRFANSTRVNPLPTFPRPPAPPPRAQEQFSRADEGYSEDDDEAPERLRRRVSTPRTVGGATPTQMGYRGAIPRTPPPPPPPRPTKAKTKPVVSPVARSERPRRQTEDDAQDTMMNMALLSGSGIFDAAPASDRASYSDPTPDVDAFRSGGGGDFGGGGATGSWDYGSSSSSSSSSSDF